MDQMDIEDLANLFDEQKKEPRMPDRIIPAEEIEAPEEQQPQNQTQYLPGQAKIWTKVFGCSHNISDAEFMMGQLNEYGFTLVNEPQNADLWLVNSCTVKGPSQDAAVTLVRKAKEQQKKIILAGCVPQADQNLLSDISVVGVTQIDKIVEAVEQTMQGNKIRLLSKKSKPKLDLPKIRKNPLIEILSINNGCLGKCTFCKTKHARGNLVSYSPEDIINRIQSCAKEGVKEFWLTSEDLGAYGIDLKTDIAKLLESVLENLPNKQIMIRLGMTNPPYIFQHRHAIAKVLQHPQVYSFIHIPVQSANNEVLDNMKREYHIEQFVELVNFLRSKVDLSLATDIICGFPGETDQQFQDTIDLIQKFKFDFVHISQFYPRPGTAAMKMQKVISQSVKERSRKLTQVFEEYTCNTVYQGQILDVWINEPYQEGEPNLVGHTKKYIKALVTPVKPELVGQKVKVKVVSTHKWHLVCKLYTPNYHFQAIAFLILAFVIYKLLEAFVFM